MPKTAPTASDLLAEHYGVTHHDVVGAILDPTPLVGLQGRRSLTTWQAEAVAEMLARNMKCGQPVVGFMSIFVYVFLTAFVSGLAASDIILSPQPSPFSIITSLIALALLAWGYWLVRRPHPSPPHPQGGPGEKKWR